MDFAKPKPTPSLEISLLDQSMSGKQNLNQTISVINRRPLTTRKKVSQNYKLLIWESMLVL